MQDFDRTRLTKILDQVFLATTNSEMTWYPVENLTWSNILKPLSKALNYTTSAQHKRTLRRQVKRIERWLTGQPKHRYETLFGMVEFKSLMIRSAALKFHIANPEKLTCEIVSSFDFFSNRSLDEKEARVLSSKDSGWSETFLIDDDFYPHLITLNMLITEKQLTNNLDELKILKLDERF